MVSYNSADSAEFPKSRTLVRMRGFIHWTYTALPPVGSVPQTRIAFTQQVDLGGMLPKFFVNSGTMSQLSFLSVMRRRFDKSVEVDKTTRELVLGRIVAHAPEAVYSKTENELLSGGEELLNTFNGFTAGTKSLRRHVSPLTTAKIAYKSGDKHAWGWATTTVRAAPEEILAFIWSLENRVMINKDTLAKTADEEPNDHNMLVYHRSGSGFHDDIIADRDFLSRCVWKKLNSSTFLFATAAEVSAKRPVMARCVRGTYPSAMIIKRKSDSETVLEYVIHPDAGGNLPTFFFNKQIGSNLSWLTTIQGYFQMLRTMEEYDADDGRALGARLMFSHKGGGVWEDVQDVVESHKGLKSLSAEHEWLVPFLEEVVKGRLTLAWSVGTTLDCLSTAEAMKIGRSLMPALKARKTPEAGLYQWKKQNRSMVELFERYAWVESMMLAISKRVMKTAPWGLRWRVSVGAGLSMLDIVTDIFVIVNYLEEEKTSGYGVSLIMMVVAR